VVKIIARTLCRIIFCIFVPVLIIIIKHTAAAKNTAVFRINEIFAWIRRLFFGFVKKKITGPVPGPTFYQLDFIKEGTCVITISNDTY
jgi:hypothetical protein